MNKYFARSVRIALSYAIAIALLLGTAATLSPQTAHAQSSCNDLPDTLGKATYTSGGAVDPETYYVHSRIKAPDGNPTFLLSIDGGGSLCDEEISGNGGNNAWIWVEHSVPLNWTSSSNLNMQVAGNKADVGLDCVVITSDQNFNPQEKEDCVVPDNEAPTVSLTAPANNATVSGAVNMTADAADNNVVTQVEFLVNGSVVGTDTTAPFSFAWGSTALANGSATISARASDAAGNTTTSGTRQVTIDNNPSGNTTTTNKASQAPTIDGVIDSVWSEASSPSSLDNTIVGSPVPLNDLSGTYRTLWTDTHVYALVEVQDDASQNDSANPWDDDSVEVYFETNNGKLTSPGSDYFQYIVRRETQQIVESQQGATTGVTTAVTNVSGGYVLELAVPWSTLNKTPSAGQNIGIDAQANDDDDGSLRDGKKSWAATTDNAYINPSLIGTTTLSDGGSSGNEPTITLPNPIVNTDDVDLTVDPGNASNINRVEFYQDNVIIFTDTTAPYSYTWDVDDPSVTNGDYSLHVIVHENGGGQTASDPVIVKVRNADINRNGTVDIFDLSVMLNNWLQNSPAQDLNDNGQVDIFDLSHLLNRWLE